MTAAQLQNLPTNPTELANRFFPPAKSLPPLTVDNVYTTDWDPVTHMVSDTGALCADPIPPKVRAALMRALDAQPGIRDLGTVTDVFGRKGIAVGADSPEKVPSYTIDKNAKDPMDGTPVKPSKVGWKKPDFGTRVQLIFDPRSGDFLGEETILTRPGGQYSKQKPGFVISYALMRGSGWTDHKPTPPTALPFG
jgi:hypothetical protein